MKEEVWKKVRCKFFAEHYKYNSKSEIKGNSNIILKSNKKGGKLFPLGRTIDGVLYKKYFNIDKLINSDFYMDAVPKSRVKNKPIKLQRVFDPKIRSCSLAEINTLNLT